MYHCRTSTQQILNSEGIYWLSSQNKNQQSINLISTYSVYKKTDHNLTTTNEEELILAQTQALTSSHKKHRYNGETGLGSDCWEVWKRYWLINRVWKPGEFKERQCMCLSKPVSETWGGCSITRPDSKAQMKTRDNFDWNALSSPHQSWQRLPQVLEEWEQRGEQEKALVSESHNQKIFF